MSRELLVVCKLFIINWNKTEYRTDCLPLLMLLLLPKVKSIPILRVGGAIVAALQCYHLTLVPVASSD